MAILSHKFFGLGRFFMGVFFSVFLSILVFNLPFSSTAVLSAPIAEEPNLDSSEDVSDASFVWDPFESLNRALFRLHVFGDTVLFDPLVSVYNGIIPFPVRIGVSNVFTNLNTPFTLANDVLQLEVRQAEESVVRLLVNTTVGFGGVFDVASYMGVEPHNEDLGQTLAVYGVGKGPYVVIPLIGGMYLRDAVGRAGESFASPWRYILDGQSMLLQGVPGVSGGFVARAGFDSQIDALRETSVDYYASSRSVYQRLRARLISNISADDVSSASIDDILDIPDLPE